MHRHDDHHHEPHEGRMRLKRFFHHGDLRLVIIKLIAEKPRHGYEIIKAIEEKVSGAYSPSPGVIYPTLTMLEELGYVRAADSGTKKLYTLTPEGEGFIATNKAAIDAIFTKIAALAEAEGNKPPQVLRAMQNLRYAVQLRLSRGDINNDQAHAIAAMLDAAATAVEKV